MSYAIVTDQVAFERALLCARGCYQRNILRGVEALSGATLRGKAKSYAARYRESASNLLDRLTSAGIAWTETRGAHGKRVLVIGGVA